jgi:enoyl-CoA hydratase/carnithine racemase
VAVYLRQTGRSVWTVGERQGKLEPLFAQNRRETSVGDSVLTDIADGVAVITINRPEARNAVDRTVAEGLAAAIDELEARSDVVIGILAGAGGTFCAGMDLKAFTRGERPSIPGRGFGGVTERPPTKPLIAAVEGWALAGGCELALAEKRAPVWRGE